MCGSITYQFQSQWSCFKVTASGAERIKLKVACLKNKPVNVTCIDNMIHKMLFVTLIRRIYVRKKADTKFFVFLLMT